MAGHGAPQTRQNRPMPEHADRVWPLSGATNFRDLGGYRGSGGRSVRWRRLFRSDHLAGLTEADRQFLRPLGLTRALDFRGPAERAAAAYELPGLVQHSLPIEPIVSQRMQQAAAAGQTLTAALVTAYMEDLYRWLIDEQAHRFAELFAHLHAADGPLVFHCTAGKDRTGLAAALVLLALGVSRTQVLQEFMLTNQVFKHMPAPRPDMPAEALGVLWRVQEGFLQAAFQSLDTGYGGIEAYLAKRLHQGPAEIRALRERYLSPG